VDQELYALWQPAEMLMRAERKRIAAWMLQQADVFPKENDQCLEVGFGSLGWLGELITWGVRETELHGIELDPCRAEQARKILPLADLRVGDASELPWASDCFHLVVASTVFTSILEPDIRRIIAGEISRVLKPGGALLWYDFAVNNPRNPHVRRVSRKELRQLFPHLSGDIRSVTLAPPLARLVAPRSWALATVLAAVPWLRTHLLGVLIKSS
jgi:ubiquinone/menaquinone biosynthesis C-methylase UbiE